MVQYRIVEDFTFTVANSLTLAQAREVMVLYQKDNPRADYTIEPYNTYEQTTAATTSTQESPP